MDYKKINFIIYIFALTFGVILYNPIGWEFRYIDEGIIAFLVLYWITNPKFVLKKEFLLFNESNRYGKLLNFIIFWYCTLLFVVHIYVPNKC